MRLLRALVQPRLARRRLLRRLARPGRPSLRATLTLVELRKRLAQPGRPSLRATLRLVELRMRLPRLLAASSLDALVEGLAPEPNAARSDPRSRARASASIRVAEALVARLHLAPDTCLFRSLGRYALLRRYGVEVTFCMGVGADPETAHAWVQDADGPIGEAIAEGAYTVTFCHPAPARGERSPNAARGPASGRCCGSGR